MKTCLYAASIVAAGLVRPAMAASSFTDTVFDVKVQYAGESSARPACITFDENGRMSIGGRRTPLVWAARPEFPDEFLAVTAPLEGTGVHNAVGVYGGLDHNNALVASGIDQFGARFVISGERRGGCDGDRNASRSAAPVDEPAALINPTGDFKGQVAPCASVFCTPATDPLRTKSDSDSDLELIDPTGEFGGQIAPCASVYCTPATNPLRAGTTPDSELELIDPRGVFNPQVAPCDASFCDPRMDPTSQPQHRAVPSLAGRSFALTLGNGSDVIEYCWSFGIDGEIETAHGSSMTWTSKAGTIGDTGFESVGIGHDGQGMAYYGSTEGNLLKVVGIEARDGKSTVIEGYGQPVARCQVNW